VTFKKSLSTFKFCNPVENTYAQQHLAHSNRIFFHLLLKVQRYLGTSR